MRIDLACLTRLEFISPPCLVYGHGLPWGRLGPQAKQFLPAPANPDVAGSWRLCVHHILCSWSESLSFLDGSCPCQPYIINGLSEEIEQTFAKLTEFLLITITIIMVITYYTVIMYHIKMATIY